MTDISKGYVVFDLETSIRAALKRRATPFYNKNIIVAIGHKGQHDDENVGRYFGSVGAEDGWLESMLEKRSFLVGFNIKFDILHGICQGPLNRKAWMEYIRRGGQIWDCQLGEYLLHGQNQENQIVSMDEVAPRYGGNLKNDAVKSLWQAGVDTPDIDRDMLMEYLIGTGQDDKGDIGNTEAIFLGQVSAFKARGGLRSALLNMSALTFTIEAEFNGMYVDLDWALAHAETLRTQLAEADEKLQRFIPEDLPFEFKWTSRFHKSALIFGGGIKYVAKEPMFDTVAVEGQPDKQVPVYFLKDELHYVLEDGTTMEQDAYDHGLSQGMDLPFRSVFAGGKNKGEFKTKKVKAPDLERGQKMRNVDKVYTFPGYTAPEDKWKSSTDGVWSTAADVMDELSYRQDVEFLAVLSKRTDIHKDLSTYFIVTDPETGEQKGMLTLVGPDGVIHHQLHMNRTITARLSSSDPNLQNVSKGSYDLESGKMKGSQIKRAFVSRFKGGKIIQSDFTSLEIYVQAALTMCHQLIEDLRAGLDMHCLRAEQAWGSREGKDYDYILAAHKDEHHPEHEKWHKLRGDAKVFSFQRAYGAGVAKIALTTGMSTEDVEALVAGEAERYPELDEYIESITLTIGANRVPTGRVVEHPNVKGLMCQLGKSHFQTPDGKLYSYSEHPAPEWIVKKPGSKKTSFSPTEIKNYVVQGTGGEWAKAAMHLAMRAFAHHDNFGGRALLVNQVHDAVYVDAAPEVATKAAALLHACMLEASNYMAWWFKWDVPLCVPSETKMGDNMMEEHSPPEEFAELAKQYQAEVRALFVNNNIPNYEKE